MTQTTVYVTDQTGADVRLGGEVHALYNGSPACTFQGTTGRRSKRHGDEVRIVFPDGVARNSWARDFGLTVTRMLNGRLV